jgi:DnaD/phage-associated family protein
MENSRGTENSPLIVRYFVNGEQYLFMPGFKGEQIGLRYDKETPDFPTFDGKNTETIRQKGGVSRREVEVETKVEVEDKETPLNPPVSLSLDQVIEVYEKNICLPGIIIDEETENQLKIAVQQFSATWVIDAIREACLQNNPTLRYIHGILKTWRREGKSL